MYERFDSIQDNDRLRKRSGHALSHRRNNAPQEDQHRDVARGGSRSQKAPLPLQDRDIPRAGSHGKSDPTDTTHYRGRARRLRGCARDTQCKSKTLADIPREIGLAAISWGRLSAWDSCGTCGVGYKKGAFLTNHSLRFEYRGVQFSTTFISSKD